MKKLSPQIVRFLDLVKEIRLEKGLSHQQLADLAKVHRSTISLMESHNMNPTLNVSLKIAHALDVKLADLIRKIEKD